MPSPHLSDISHSQPASRNDLASQHIPRRRRLQLVAPRCFESLPVSTRLLQTVQARWSKTPLPPSTLLSSPSSTTPRSGVSIGSPADTRQITIWRACRLTRMGLLVMVMRRRKEGQLQDQALVQGCRSWLQDPCRGHQRNLHRLVCKI